jgi:hypothetical protein
MRHVLRRSLGFAVAGLIAAAGVATPAHADDTGLSGVITEDGTSTPLGQVDVEVFTIVDVPGGQSTKTVAWGSTDDAGAFSFPDLAPGKYHVGLNKDGYVHEYSGNTRRAFDSAEVSAPGEFNDGMVRAAVVSGTFLDRDGKPVESGSVTASPVNPQGDLIGDEWGTLGPDGYTIGGLVPGKYKIQFSPSDRNPQWAYGAAVERHGAQIKLKAGANVVNDVLLPVPTGVVQGVVTDRASGAPIKGICVGINAEIRPIPDSGEICTGADGAFRFSGLPDETATLTVWDRDGRRYVTNGSFPVSAQDGQIITRNIPLDLGGRITGVMVDADTGNLAPRYMCVDAKRVDGKFGSGDCGDNAQAKFTIGALPGGSYKFHVSVGQFGNQSPYAVGWLKEDGSTTADEADASVFRVRPGTTKHLGNVRLAKGATISGVVTDKATGKPVQDVQVGIGHYSPRYPGFGDIQATTDAAGRYTLHNIAAGSWPVSFIPQRPYAATFSGGATTRAEASHVDLGIGAAGTMDAALEPGNATLAGTIAMSGKNYEIELHNADDEGDYVGEIAWGSVTNGTAPYSIERIVAQRVKVAVIRDGKTLWYGGSGFGDATVVDLKPGANTLGLTGF